MFIKTMLFFLLWRLLGNPILAILVLLVVFYILERRYIGLTPSLLKPLRRSSAISRARRQLLVNSHDVTAKMELARLLLEGKRYREAITILIGIESQMEHSAEYWSDRGLSELALNQVEEGEQSLLRALDISPRVKYGLPYLRLAEAYAKSDTVKAAQYLESFQSMNASSCEAYYRLGVIYRTMGRSEDARHAFEECRQVYKTLPRYLKRKERRWAYRAALAKK